METWHIVVLIVNILMVMVGAMLSIIFWMAKTAFMELKQEVIHLRNQKTACREELAKEYISKDYMNKWEKGRDGLWAAINKYCRRW